jgi:MSHA pilin protein MshC
MSPARASAGFTLVEIAMTIVLVGILASVALPRLVDLGTFDARGFHDETLALLRYAQKSAVSHRRTVCVAFTSNSAVLTMASAAASSTCNTNLAGPQGETPATVTAKAGIVYAATPAGFSFNGLGKPSFSSTRTLQVTGLPVSIKVEAETGHVHE